MAPTPTPTPIRTALVGLTARPNVYDWGGSVHLAYITSSPHYELTAICNSSVSAAAAAKEKYHLPPTVKTYGSPADLAADADVDLVVVVVRASRHRDVAMPSLAAGKMVFVEWPLGRNVAEAEEMQALAAAKGLRTMVGLQSRQTGVFNKVKELLDAGKLGKVLSTSLSGAVLSGGGMEDSSIAYALDENSGSTFVDVHFAHLLEGVTYSLSSTITSLSSLVATQRPTTSLIDNTTTPPTITANVAKTAPDQVVAHGTLSSGAVLSVHLRGGTAALDNGFRWQVYGTEGELVVTGWAPLLHINVPGITWRVRLADAAGEVVLDEQVGSDPAGSGADEGGVGGAQPSVGRLYEAFALGKTGGYVDFAGGLERQKWSGALWESNKKGERVVL